MVESKGQAVDCGRRATLTVLTAFLYLSMALSMTSLTVTLPSPTGTMHRTSPKLTKTFIASLQHIGRVKHKNGRKGIQVVTRIIGH